MRRRHSNFLLLVVGFSFMIAGCGPKPAPTGSNAGGGSATDDETLSADDRKTIDETLAKLTPEDRDAAEKQRICPVGGGPLGMMGVPPKVEVEGREVFLCCEGCEEMLRGDPAKYFAKLDDE